MYWNVNLLRFVICHYISHLYAQQSYILSFLSPLNSFPFFSTTKVEKTAQVDKELNEDAEKKAKPLDSPAQENTTDSSEPQKSKEDEQDELKVRHIFAPDPVPPGRKKHFLDDDKPHLGFLSNLSMMPLKFFTGTHTRPSVRFIW